MKIAYSTGAYDILRAKDLQELDKQIQIGKEDDPDCIFALGIYDDNLCQALGMNKPIKCTEDRAKIMEQIRGVDFTFTIPSRDPKIIIERLREEYEIYEMRKKTRRNWCKNREKI